MKAGLGRRVFALLCALLALLPTSWLVGTLAPDDPRQLDVGVWIHRAAFLALGAWLFLAPRAQRGALEEQRWRPVDLLLLVLISIAARLPGLNAQLWFDEMWMVVDYVRHPLPEVLRSYPSDNNHPLYSLLATASAKLFGETPWSIRLPAFLFGILGAPMLHVFGASQVGRRRAFVAALLLALSFHHVSFSLNARGYTGMVFFSLLSSHALLRGLKGRSTAFWTHGIALALGIWLHLTLLFVAVGQFLLVVGWALGSRAPDRLCTLRRAIASFVFGALLTIACHGLILPQMVQQLLLKKKVVAAAARWTDPLWLLEEVAKSFGLGFGPGLVLSSLALAILLVGLWKAWKEAPAVVALLLLPGLVSTAAFLGLGRNLWPRLYFFLAGFLVLAATLGAFGILELWPKTRRPDRRLLQRGLEVLLVLGCLFTLRRGWYPKQDFEGARRYVEEQVGAGVPVATVGLAILPYREYRPSRFVPVESVEEFEALFPSGAEGYVLSTFPIFMESRQPELWKLVQQRCEKLKGFPGAIGGGEVVVFRVTR